MHDDHWLWSAALRKGYGAFRLDIDTVVAAHRLAYEWLVGPIDEGLVIDHLCGVTACVRPDHLRATTQQVNVASAKVACRRCGTPYAAYGRERRCIPCRRAYDRRRRAKVA